MSISTNDGFNSNDQALIAGGGVANSIANELDLIRAATPIYTIRVSDGKELAIVIL